jgi:hypothetical protein
MPGIVGIQQQQNTGQNRIQRYAQGGNPNPTAGGQLVHDQAVFAATLAASTGLNPKVVAAWCLAEESGSAATARQNASNNDWLNIGYTDSATYGSSDNIWSSPVKAARATAGWLKGQNTIPGYGTASAGIQAILNTRGKSAATQIQAIQKSGWASSGYPDLPSIYNGLTSGTFNQLAVSGDGNNPVTGAVGLAKDVASPITDLTKAIGFIFSLQFLYIVAGGMLMLVAIVMLAMRSNVASKLPPIPIG